MKRNPRTLYIIEVVLLDVLLVLLTVILTGWLRSVVQSFPLETRGDTLAMIGLILAGSLAANFSITYNGSKLESIVQRYFAHATKFFLQLSIALNLEMALSALEPGIYVDGLFLVGLLLYAAILLFNIWDVLRATDDLIL